MSRFNQAGEFISRDQCDIFIASAVNDDDLSILRHLIA
jgi:hypothetical protein